MQIAFPYVFDTSHVTRLANEPVHVRQMLEQLLFTMPGERVNRPDFGCGIQRMVFAPQSTEVVATLQALVESEIHRWMGDVMSLRKLEVSAEDATLRVLVEFQLPRDNIVRAERFERAV
ncbi:MAG: GPW/gp25 family protein [Rhizobiales bacterium]|nr:GPW/gp25 family protein [Hyphomicrobiales bacterium]